jgi:hypothetical protein
LKYATYFLLYRGSQLRVALNLRGDLKVGLLNNVGTVETMGVS